MNSWLPNDRQTLIREQIKITDKMHEFKTYEITYKGGSKEGKKALFSACCKCGTIETRGGIEQQTCSEKMHANSNVRILNMRLVE